MKICTFDFFFQGGDDVPFSPMPAMLQAMFSSAK